MEDVSESGYYDCPYDDCSETFFFDKDTGTLHSVEELQEETIKDEIVIVCPNPDCGQELRIPNTTETLQVTCPKCGTYFRYPLQSEEASNIVSELLAEFDEALEDEIKVVKTRGGNISVMLKDGKLVGEIAGYGIYRFNIERKVPVIDETPAQIEIRGKNYRATIVSFLDFKLEIRIWDFEEEEIPSALLSVDATYVLRKLKEALPSLESQDVDLALKTFNRIPLKCSEGKPVFILTDTDEKNLDDFQTKAMKICLGNEVAFVHGPPGTGKTRTLVNVANDFANNGKKVLVSCHTNVACDNVIKHFLKYGHEATVKNLLKDGEIVRIGTPVLQDVKPFTIEEIRENLSRDLREERERLNNLMNSLMQKNELYYGYKQRFLEHRNLAERVENCKENIIESEDLIRGYIQREEELNQIISQKKQLLSIAEGRNAIINFLKGTRPKNLRLEIVHLENEKTSETKNRFKEEKRLGLLSAELQKLNSLVSKASMKLPQCKNLEQIEEVLKKTEGTLENAKTKIAEIDDRISKLNEGILDNAKVIVSTLARTFTDPILSGIRFDVVLIDEASIAPLPMVFYVCSLAKEKVSIFGDPRQLAPIKLAATDAAQKWLGRDIFQEANATENRPHDPRIESLNLQYRMHDEIFKIVNLNFYGNLYNTRPEIDKDYRKYDNILIPMPKHRVVIIDTTKVNACVSTEKLGPKRRSRYNLYNVEVVEKVLHDLIEGNLIEQKDIGIITPYRSQASFLREMLKESRWEDVEVGTVHTFQGREKRYIIFDLVEALGTRKIGILLNDKHELYLKKDQSENEARRLLTVAFSRPQEKLVIISHNQLMLNNLPKGSVLRKIIADLLKRGQFIDSSTLVPYYVPTEEYPDIALFNVEELLRKEAVFNQKSFYPSLIQDLKNAQKEVLFISGYMTTNRIEKLMPYLTDLLSRGVNVGIITKPPGEQMSRERELEGLYRALKNIGIKIQERYGTHEKIVAIDGHILYAGSLNVLSFNHSSKEMMIRSDSKSKLQKVFSVLAKDPKMRECLTKSGYILKPVLPPQKFQNILDRVRPKHRELPKNKREVKEYYRSMLKKLRWVIADDKRIPNFAVLFNDTIENLLNDPPKTVEQLLSLPEFMRNRTNIRGYEDIVLKILKEYRDDC